MIGQTKFDYNLNLGNRNLPGNFTPGAWFHTGAFNDMRLTLHRAVYRRSVGFTYLQQASRELRGVRTLEQTIYRAPGDNAKGVSASAKGITTFARAAFSPPDRNLIDFYADFGIAFNRLVPARPEDRSKSRQPICIFPRTFVFSIRTWNISVGNRCHFAPSKW